MATPRLTDKSNYRDGVDDMYCGSGSAAIADNSRFVLLLQRATWSDVETKIRRTGHRVRLGPWPIVSAAEARQQCLSALQRLYRGEPVKLAKPTVAPTLASVLTDYLASRQISKKSAADLRSVVAVHAAAWVNRPVDELDAKAVATHYRAVASKSLGQAIRLLAALSALTKYSHAAHGVGDATLIQRARSLLGSTDAVAARDVVITDELQAKWRAAVDSESAQVSRYFKALMLTGMRLNELRKLPVTGWDSAARTISIPTSKNGNHCCRSTTCSDRKPTHASAFSFAARVNAGPGARGPKLCPARNRAAALDRLRYRPCPTERAGRFAPGAIGARIHASFPHLAAAMTSLELRRLAFLLAALAPHAFAQGEAPTEPAQVTDAQIAVIRNNIQFGCIRRGLQRGGTGDDVRALCACVAGVMRDQFTPDESRQLVVAAFKNQDGVAEALLQRHRDAMMACRTH